MRWLWPCLCVCLCLCCDCAVTVLPEMIGEVMMRAVCLCGAVWMCGSCGRVCVCACACAVTVL